MDDRGAKIQKLKDYFEKREDVAMAFLFGSRANNMAHTESDWDVAVYFKPASKRMEWNADADYPQEHEVWGDIERILESGVDFIVLNRAYPTVADSALRGIPLAIKDRALWLNFMLRITSEAIDFRKTTREHYQIFMRSASLTAQDAHELERKIEFLESELEFLSEFTNLSWEEYRDDRVKRSVAERSIEKMMNAAIDVSKIISGSSRKPIPMSYREIISAIGGIAPFSREITEKLSQWAELRNFLAHEYLDYSWKQADDFLKNAQVIFSAFIASAKKFLKENVQGNASKM